jgi:branched-chain amino acid transport system permease protein
MRAFTVPELERTARTTGNRAGLVLLALLGIWPLVAQDPVLLRQFVYIGIFALVAVGLNLTLGYAGEFALGQAGVFAVGAYTAGILTTKYGWSFWLAVLAAVAAACVVGMVIGLPGLRLGGWYFALTSLFIAVVIPDVARVVPHTGGPQGFGGIPFPNLFGQTLSYNVVYAGIAVSVAIALFLQRNLIQSRWGLAFLRMRQSNRAAEASGISVLRLKLLAYVLAAGLAGYAGAILPHVAGYLAPDAFPLSLSIQLIAAVTLGGTGSIAGPVIGMALLQWLPSEFSGFDKYSLLIYGSILIVGMIFIRRGLIPTISDLFVALVLRIGRQRGWLADHASTEEGDAGVHEIPADTVRAAHGGLVIEGISKHFYGVKALTDVSLVALPGEITAVIGPNGSGKTTLLNSILNFYTPDQGTVTLGDVRLSGHRPFTVARHGVARTFQTPMVMAESSCRDNVLSAAYTGRKVSLIEVLLRLPRARRDVRDGQLRADQLLRFVGLGNSIHTLGGALTAGQQRLLDIARALAPGAAVILLDEPAAGLVGDEVEFLADVLRRLRAAGMIVVLVEHNVNLVMALADRVVVLDQGQVIADADPATVSNDPAVLRSYLGTVADA